MDPCHYFSSPRLRWDAMLKMTEIELEHISVNYMHLFVEKRMRGGIFYIAKRYSKVKNKYMKFYDHNKPDKYIMLDANNLYGWASSQYLPYSEFKWQYQKEIDKFNGNFIGKNTSDGCILQVDLEYPDELHEWSDGYPLSPKNLEINHNTLSKHCSNLANK